jgi:hypothetical protein
MFKNECFQKCPEGTASYIYRYNGEWTAKCVNSDEFLDDKECELDVKASKLKYPEVTEEILTGYAEEYVHDYPVANSYVTSYLSPDTDTMNKYLIVLYKLEKCPKQKVEGFIPIGLDECIDKVKTKLTNCINAAIDNPKCKDNLFLMLLDLIESMERRNVNMFLVDYHKFGDI